MTVTENRHLNKVRFILYKVPEGRVKSPPISSQSYAACWYEVLPTTLWWCLPKIKSDVEK